MTVNSASSVKLVAARALFIKKSSSWLPIRNAKNRKVLLKHLSIIMYPGRRHSQVRIFSNEVVEDVDDRKQNQKDFDVVFVDILNDLDRQFLKEPDKSRTRLIFSVMRLDLRTVFRL